MLFPKNHPVAPLFGKPESSVDTVSGKESRAGMIEPGKWRKEKSKLIIIILYALLRE